MKDIRRICILGIALLLLFLCGTYLYGHFVHNQIADLGGMENVFPEQRTSPADETLHTFTYSLSSNQTTGYEWKALIIEGDSVSVNTYGYYQEDPNPEMADGVGGTQYFDIHALKPGTSLLHFIYSRDAYDVDDERYLMVTVDEDLRISVQTVTERAASECDATD